MLLELFFLGLILLGIYIIIKILQKFFRIFAKFYRYIGERLIIRKFVYSFRKNKQIYLNKIINFILPLLKKNPQMYDKWVWLYKKLDYNAVTFKFWWLKKSSKKKVLKWSLFIFFCLLTYYYINKVLLLTIPQFFLVVLDLIIRFIWIFFLRGTKWRHQTFEEKVKDYEDFRQNLHKTVRDFFKRK